MKKLLLMLLGVLMTFPMLAQRFKYTYEGRTLFYMVISDDDKTCTVLGYDGNVLGDLVIPAVAIDENDNRYFVTTIGGNAFAGCSNLTSVTIPNSVTKIGSGAFADCNNLKEILVEESSQNYCSADGVLFDKEQTKLILFPTGKSGDYVIPTTVSTIEGNAFYGCRSLTSVTIPNSVFTIGFGAFALCSSLTSVTIPNSVTTIERSTFYMCSSLISVTIPNSVTIIGSAAFRECYGLTSIEIPNSVTIIESSAFGLCSNLTSVAIPNSVIELWPQAFEGCSSLTSVYYNAEEPVESTSSVFYVYENATLYVPAAAVEKCKLIDPWKNFGSIQAYEFTGINDVAADIDGNLPCEVYTTSGVKVADAIDGLKTGIYIVRQGNVVKKIAVN